MANTIYTYKNYKYYLKRNPSSSFNGYVQIRNNQNGFYYLNDYCNSNIKCHGGITYDDSNNLICSKNNHIRTIGFDTNHDGDYDFSKKPTNPVNQKATIWSQKDVREQCRLIINQLIKIQTPRPPFYVVVSGIHLSLSNHMDMASYDLISNAYDLVAPYARPNFHLDDVSSVDIENDPRIRIHAWMNKKRANAIHHIVPDSEIIQILPLHDLETALLLLITRIERKDIAYKKQYLNE